MVPVYASAKSVAYPSSKVNSSANSIGNTKSISNAQNARTAHQGVNHRITKRRVTRAVYAFLPFDFKYHLSSSTVGDMNSGYYATPECFLIFHFAYF